MSWQVRPNAGGWELVAPSGQVAGSVATREEAVETVKYLGRVKALGKRKVGGIRVPTMTPTLATQLKLSRRERDQKARAGRVSAKARKADPALARWLDERERRNAA